MSALVIGGAPLLVVGAAVVAKLAIEGEVLRRRRDERGELSRTARLLSGTLQVPVGRRLALVALGLAVLSAAPPLGIALILAGDLVERGLLFRAVSPDRMP